MGANKNPVYVHKTTATTKRSCAKSKTGSRQNLNKDVKEIVDYKQKLLIAATVNRTLKDKIIALESDFKLKIS